MMKAFVLVALICFIRPIEVPQEVDLEAAISWKNIECLLMSEVIRNTVKDLVSLVTQHEWRNIFNFIITKYPEISNEVMECMSLKMEPVLGSYNLEYRKCILFLPKAYCQKYLDEDLIPDDNETNAKNETEDN